MSKEKVPLYVGDKVLVLHVLRPPEPGVVKEVAEGFSYAPYRVAIDGGAYWHTRSELGLPMRLVPSPKPSGRRKLVKPREVPRVGFANRGPDLWVWND